MSNWKLLLESGIEINAENLPINPKDNQTGLLLIDGVKLKGLHHFPFSPAHTVLIDNPVAAGSLEFISTLVGSEYAQLDDVHYSNDGKKWDSIQLGQVKNCNEVNYLLLPGKDPNSSLEGFEEIIAHLRAPDGCPWDQKQTHTSLRSYLLEETYEALDALDRNDVTSLKEELGDLLLQIVVHTQIAQEKDEFTMGDILTGINRKIVFRHPHVFDNWKVDNEQQVIQNWESLKGQEREANKENGDKGLLDGVPLSYPALAQAQALQERAARVGFDWKEIAPVLDKIREELDEIENAQTESEQAKEFGDLLFALVNFIRWKKIDAESILRQTNAKFRKRFAYIEKSVKTSGKLLQEMTLEEMDVLWEQAKQYDD